MREIYLDNNATTPLLPEVLEAMLPYFMDRAGNPSSSHRTGRSARRALEDAREKIAFLLGAHADEVIFTSGATEANNLALFGLAGNEPCTVLASPIEHPSVSEPVRQLAAQGCRLHAPAVDSQGIIDAVPEIPEKVGLACLMLANHETGAIQPVEAWRDQLAGRAPLHCDAAAAVGKMPVDFHRLGASTMTVSAHKFHGPKGIGALLVQRCQKLRPLLWGGHQQRGMRPGTEPVPLVVGFARALEAATSNLARNRCQLAELRRRFLEVVRDEAEPVVLNGPAHGGLPGTLNLSFPGCQADSLLMALDLAGVACSTGSACSSGSLLPSPVLRAMNVSAEILHSAMRFSFSATMTSADAEEAARRITLTVNKLRHRSAE